MKNWYIAKKIWYAHIAYTAATYLIFMEKSINKVLLILLDNFIL